MALLAVMLAACSRSAPPPPPDTPPVVGIITTQAVNLPIIRNYPGRLAATLTAQVRARITGIVLKRVYKEGSDVNAGDVLFQIDPAPLQATLRSQQGLLAQAEATARNAELKASRNKQLGAKGLLDKQTVDDAVAAAAAAAAAVKTAKANVENAKIDLTYATVTSPISGRAGMANVTQGALVQPTDDKPLTTIQVIDPIYANFSEPMAEVEKLQQAEKADGPHLALSDKAQVSIVLPGGSIYKHAGSVDFTGLAVDPNTGTVDVRALLPNPDHALLPGMFVTVRLTLGVLKDTFSLPQAAIQRDAASAYVFLLDAEDKVVEKRITLGDQNGANWIVTSGITAGEHVIVSGTQNVHPGDKVRSITYQPGTT